MKLRPKIAAQRRCCHRRPSNAVARPEFKHGLAIQWRTFLWKKILKSCLKN